MIFLPIAVLITALIVGFLGFGGATATAVGIAKLLFFASIVLILIASLIGWKTPIR